MFAIKAAASFGVVARGEVRVVRRACRLDVLGSLSLWERVGVRAPCRGVPCTI